MTLPTSGVQDMADVNETDDDQDFDAGLYALSRKISATFVNNFLVTGTSSMIRIAFAESADAPVGPQYHVAVVLPLEDAKELGRIVLKMISEIEGETKEKS
jgi:hypothetical protein